MSKSETIGVSDARRLMVFTKDLARYLTQDEFLSVLAIYDSAVDRIEKEETHD